MALHLAWEMYDKSIKLYAAGRVMNISFLADKRWTLRVIALLLAGIAIGSFYVLYAIDRSFRVSVQDYIRIQLSRSIDRQVQQAESHTAEIAAFLASRFTQSGRNESPLQGENSSQPPFGFADAGSLSAHRKGRFDIEVAIGSKLAKLYDFDELAIIQDDLKLDKTFQPDNIYMARLMSRLKPVIAYVRAQSLAQQTTTGVRLADNGEVVEKVGFLTLPKSIGPTYGQNERVSRELFLVSAAEIPQYHAADSGANPNILIGIKRFEPRLVKAITPSGQPDVVFFTAAEIQALSSPSENVAPLGKRIEIPINNIYGRSLGAIILFGDFVSSQQIIWIGLIIVSSVLLALLLYANSIASIALTRIRFRDKIARLGDTLNIDEMTGLLTRHAFEAKILNLKSTDRTRGDRYLIVAVLLDGFADFQEMLDLSFARKLCQNMGEHLKSLENTKGAYLGDGVFALLAGPFDNIDNMKKNQMDIIDTCHCPATVDGMLVIPSLSVGVAQWPQNGANLAHLLPNAIIALRAAQLRGGGQMVSYSGRSALDANATSRVTKTLSEMAGGKNLDIAYLPQISIGDNSMVALEAKIRWQQNIVRNAQSLLHLAEITGKTRSIGLWALERVLSDAEKWPHLLLSLNLSLAQLQFSETFSSLSHAIKSSQIDPANLEFEISAQYFAMEHRQIKDNIHQLKNLGCRIALDHFGGSQADLQHIMEFPFDTIKVSRKLISNIDTSQNASSILGTIINLGKVLDIKIVATGVETAQQAAIIRLTNCARMQGGYLSQALPANEVKEFEQNLIREDPQPAFG